MTTWNDSASLDDSRGDDPSRWSRQQLVRLENEWRRLQRSFAFHPHVHVSPLDGDPPEQYQVEFFIRTVVLDDQGQLQYADRCTIHIWLPPAFPHEPPLARPVSDLFHPNVVADGIGIDRAWTSASSTLVDVVRAVGAMLSFQDWDVDAVYNPEAMAWVEGNSQILPTDPDADFSDEAGGDALARLCRGGRQALEETRGRLKGMCDRLLAPQGAPSDGDLKRFVCRTRQELGLLMEKDVPEDLRAPASALDDAARELGDTAPLWKLLRTYRGIAEHAAGLTQQLAEVEQSLTAQIGAVRRLPAPDVFLPPAQIIRHLPPAARLQMHQSNFINFIDRCEQLLDESRPVAAQMAALPALDASFYDSMLRRRLDAEIAHARALEEKAQARLNAAIGRLQPVRAEAGLYTQGLHRAAQWREYADLMDRAGDLARKAMDLGALGAQAYFVENPAGRFGPFELEQKLTLGAASLVARNPASSILQVLDAENSELLGEAENGVLALALPDPESDKPVRTGFNFTGNCEELAVQFDYLIRETVQMIQELAPAVRGPEGWLGQTIESLGTDEAWNKTRADHDSAHARYVALRDDLRALRPFRERLATLRLLERMADLAEQRVAKLQANRAIVAETEDRLSTIASASNTDLETGRLLVPQKFAREYADCLRRRDLARTEIAMLLKRMAAMAEEIRWRVTDPDRLGQPQMPAMALLGELPPNWEELAPQMADRAMAARLTQLEGQLKAPLQPEGWPPSSAEEDEAPQAATAPLAAEPAAENAGAEPAPLQRPADPFTVPADQGGDDPPDTLGPEDPSQAADVEETPADDHVDFGSPRSDQSSRLSD